MSKKESLNEKEKEITPQTTHPKKQPPRYTYEDKKQTHIKNEPKIGPSGGFWEKTQTTKRAIEKPPMVR